jgi:F-type H+-transporting ATPase subunit delta
MSSALVSRYANTVYNQISTQDVEMFTTKCLEISKSFKEKKIEAFYNSPVTSFDEKRQALEKIKNLISDETLFNLLLALAERSRLGLLSEISEKINEIQSKKSGKLNGIIYSKFKLTVDKITSLENKISKKLNANVKLNFQQDDSVLAGVKIKVGSYLIDDSTDFHFKNLKEKIKTGAL